jgi:hypothetical protein
MATLTTNQLTNLVNPQISKIYAQELAEYRGECDSLFKTKNSKQKSEYLGEISGLGAAVQKDQGAVIYADTIYKGADQTITHVAYALSYLLTKEMKDDDLQNQVNRFPKFLAEGMREREELQKANVFNQAFTGGTLTYSDGKVLVVDTHTRLDGGSAQSNVLSVAADLSPSSLKTALTMLRKMRGPRGEYLKATPESLIISPDLEFDAYQILNSIQLAGQANWDVNSIKNLYNLKPKVITRLTDTDAWFLQASEAISKEYFIFFWRNQPDLESDAHLSTRDTEYNSYMRFSITVAPGGWRTIVGTPGAA